MVARDLIEPSSEEPLLPQFYANKHILITGATGFMGKVLIERILATCPDVGTLYLVMRTKKDVPPEKRLEIMKQGMVFDVIRSKCPSQLTKLRAIAGDTAAPGLGISEQDLRKIREVSIVFHVAATLKFDEEINKAMDENVRSVMRLLDICDTFPHVESFMHVSTAYCNCNAPDNYIEEKVYPAPAPLQDMLKKLDNRDTKRLLSESNKPNTYTFTKALAETAIVEHRARYPVAIFRPTIVISSTRHPYPGWIENMNGPSGAAAGAGKGLLHTFRLDTAARADLLPVDMAASGMLVAAWDAATSAGASSATVYNCAVSPHAPTWGQFEKQLRTNLAAAPLDRAVWYPSGYVASNKFVHKAFEFLLQTAPLHLMEYTATILGIKTPFSPIAVSNKLRAMSDVLAFFSLREWRFQTDNMARAYARISERDREIYDMRFDLICWPEQFKNFIIGVRKYLLKEKDEDLEAAKRRMKKLYYIHNGVKLLAMLAILRLILMTSPTARSFVYGNLRLTLSLFTSARQRLINWNKSAIL